MLTTKERRQLIKLINSGELIDISTKLDELHKKNQSKSEEFLWVEFFETLSAKDLNNLLDQLNIQVENPVAVLDQEEAKKFLMGKAEDKYNFFIDPLDAQWLPHAWQTTDQRPTDR